MSEFLKHVLGQRVTFVWLALVAATAFSWAMGTGEPGEGGLGRPDVTALLIGVAMLKARLVIRFFMEVREAALPLRVLLDVWCAGVGVVVIALLWGAA